MAEQGERFLLRGNPDIEVRFRRAANTRRLKLRVSHLDGRVTVSSPPRVVHSVVRAFVEEKEDWIRTQLAQCPDEIFAVRGSTIPIEGRMTLVDAGPVSAPRLSDRRLVVSECRPVEPQVAAFLKTRARDRLAHACNAHAKRLGREYGRLTLRDTRSRWGSCSSSGNLMFSWRLVMATPEVLDYVAAHEVAHLQEMNHSAVFWRLVEELCPDYAVQKRWLREHGSDLHRIRFKLRSVPGD